MPSLKQRCKATGVALLGYLPPLPKVLLDWYVSKRVGHRGPATPVVDFVSLHAGETESQRMLVEELPAQAAGTIRLVIMSDTHERHRTVSVPAADLLVHSGDLLMSSSLAVQSRGEAVLADFDAWLATLPCKEKVVIGGNHDAALRRAPHLITNATLLDDTAVTLEASGLKVYGNSYSEGHSHNSAWQAAHPSVSEACRGADIVLSHECASSLQQRVLPRCRPLVWASGHSHSGHGVKLSDGTLFVNAAIQDTSYNPVQPPIVVDLAPPRRE